VLGVTTAEVMVTAALAVINEGEVVEVVVVVFGSREADD